MAYEHQKGRPVTRIQQRQLLTDETNVGKQKVYRDEMKNRRARLPRSPLAGIMSD